jgi:hypothetical protein
MPICDILYSGSSFVRQLCSVTKRWRLTYVVTTVVLLANAFGIGAALEGAFLALEYVRNVLWLPALPLAGAVVLAAVRSRKERT